MQDAFRTLQYLKTLMPGRHQPFVGTALCVNPKIETEVGASTRSRRKALPCTRVIAFLALQGEQGRILLLFLGVGGVLLLNGCGQSFH